MSSIGEKLQYAQRYLRSETDGILPKLAKKDLPITEGMPLAEISEALDEWNPTSQQGEINVKFIYRDTITGEEKVVEHFVNAGESLSFPEDVGNVQATATNPDLIFQGWNVDASVLTNIQNNIIAGAIYATADGKTYAYVTLKQTSASDTNYLYIKLLFNKSDNSELTVDWGDGTTHVSSLQGNLTRDHMYAEPGDYVITFWISNGNGTIGLGGPGDVLTFLGGSDQIIRNRLLHCYIGNNIIIHQYAFCMTYSLKSLTIPNGFTYIDERTLSYTALTNICLPATITSLSTRAIYSSLRLQNFSAPGVEEVQTEAFYLCFTLENVYLPKLTSLATNCFRTCYQLKDVTVSKDMTTLGNGCFHTCVNLKKVNFPSLKAAGSMAFQACYSLRELPSKSFETLGTSTFVNNYFAEELVITSKTTNIESNAIKDLLSLKRIIMESSVPPAIAATTPFLGLPLDCKIYVPDASVSAYKTATNWTQYAGFITPMSELQG